MGSEAAARRTVFGRQSGQGKLGCILWIIFLVVAGMVASKMIPVKIKTSEFADFMNETAQFPGRGSSDDIRKILLGKAKELDLPIKEDDIKVDRQRERIKMEATYTIPIEFPGYTYMWTFHQTVDRPIFIV